VNKQFRTASLGNFCLVIAGQSPNGSAYNDVAEGLPFYQGKKEFGQRYISSPRVWTREITKVAEPDDILMSVRAPVGPVNFTKEKICIGRGLAAIRPKSELNRSYLFYFLLSAQNILTGKAGAVFPSISKADIESIQLRVPTLAEQRRIVGILDEAFAGLDAMRANTEANARSGYRLFEAEFNRIMTPNGGSWVEARFSEICEIKHGFAFDGQYFTSEGEFVLMTPGNFFETGGYRDRGEKQKYYVGEIPRGYLLSKGDLLVAMTEQAVGLLGSPAIVPESGKFLHNQRLGLVTPKRGASWIAEFFFHVFNTNYVRVAIQNSASGTKVRHTSPNKIGDVLVRFPSEPSEQVRVANTIAELRERTDTLQAIYESKLAAIDELRKSLLHQAFSGNL